MGDEVKEVERLARLICQAMEPRSDPDAKAYFGIPYHFECGAVSFSEWQLRPLWTAYRVQAMAVFNELSARPATSESA